MKKVKRKLPQKYPLVKDISGTGKDFLEDILDSMENRKLYEALGVTSNTSYILEGPPGVGKTFAVEALNNEYNKEAANINHNTYDSLYKRLSAKNDRLQEGQQMSDDEIGNRVLRIMEKKFKIFMFEYTIGMYGTAYINKGAKNLQIFFNTGIKMSYQKPTILVFDEAEALMGKRGASRSHNEDDKNLQTIMTNLQRIQDNPNLFVIMMTNRPRSMDKAVIRPGRINKRYKFRKPDKQARLDLLEKIIGYRNEKAGYKVIRRYNLEELAEITENFSNADIDHVIKEALRKRAREISRERNDKLIPKTYITQVRIKKAIEKHRKKFKLKDKVIGYGRQK